MTETPTFTPEPTQTVIPWATPTPFSVSSDAPQIDFAFDGVPVSWAETVVQGFNIINTNNFFDGILWIIIIIFVLIAFRRLINNIRGI